MPDKPIPINPVYDIWEFLTGTSNDHMLLGNWRFLFVALFLGLVLASVYLFVRNWREDPGQRSAAHVSFFVARFLIGCMWFQGMLWKLPLPASGALRYWTEKQMGTRAAFELHREIILNFLVPNIHFFGPLVFLAELTFAASLILGLGVRFAGALGTLFVLHLWLGIYRPDEPAEWPWLYIFLALLMFLFAMHGAGRSLGLDAWLRRNAQSVREGTGFWGKLFKAAG
jgi:uncharacterized membrane protein YphA (DoxX/SURF4 family)